MAKTSTERLVRSRPAMVTKPAAPTSAAARNTPSDQWESKPKIELISSPPPQSRTGSMTLTTA
jgi:hypothetical protein